MDYEIRKASLRDMPNIEAIYANARAFMAERGNPASGGPTGLQWPDCGRT